MLPYPWRLSISIVRVALGIGCIALQLFLERSLFSWGLLPIVAFLAYSLYALRRSMESEGRPLLTLSIDTGAFLVWLILTGNAGFGGRVWAVSALSIYGFLLTCAVLNHEWRRVLAVAAVCLIAVIGDPAH